MAAIHVKVCGLTRTEDVAAAVTRGAWAVGFVVWPGSPRFVTLSKLRDLTADVPAGVKRVGVAVNPDLDDVRRWRDEAGVTTLQLHGGEDVAPFLSLGMDIFKAVSLEADDDVERAAALPAEVTVLVDAHDPVRLGGTGNRADWARAATLSRRRPVILAGGLRAENVEEAIVQVSPWAIDVSSGLESEPGIKDHAKLARFFAMLRADGGPGL
ncbi:MAG TPA: phosphoribosylanthranilate isomerase [Vicinamibacterales bacterium]|nr:phosphoribosylanthranilate isomerase [Vicinamibacterales bacterium]